MAIELTTTDHIKTLLNSTVNLKLTTVLAGITDALRLRIHGLTDEFTRVFVDRSPDWQSIFTVSEVQLLRPGIRLSAAKLIIVYSKTREALLSTLLQTSNAYQEDGSKVYFLDTRLLDDELTNSVGGKLIFKPHNGFYIAPGCLSPEMFKTLTNLPEGYSFRKVSQEDAAMIHSHLNVPVKPSLDLFKGYLRILPTLCVQDSDGKCVAWALKNPWGLGHNLFTIPEHRDQGLGRAVLLELCRQSEKYSLLNVAGVASENIPSMNLFQKTPCAFQLEGQLVGISVDSEENLS